MNGERQKDKESQKQITEEERVKQRKEEGCY